MATQTGWERALPGGGLVVGECCNCGEVKPGAVAEWAGDERMCERCWWASVTFAHMHVHDGDLDADGCCVECRDEAAYMARVFAQAVRS